MIINGCKIIGARSGFTGSVLLYVVNGKIIRGFPLQKDEFVTSLRVLEEMKEKAGVA